ncbi:hypothetical protein EVG20_g4765 [Dentipellis fragilis]|uniref:Protein kinase domain-containing protein n=1 Tax=Dentipellis fragilis TaxID=205917 RepID=A0A4Y9YV62_9AGAM|nr:hypothetical protein EVG20_g4765 [Dentipellis fragilis]
MTSNIETVRDGRPPCTNILPFEELQSAVHSHPPIPDLQTSARSFVATVSGAGAKQQSLSQPSRADLSENVRTCARTALHGLASREANCAETPLLHALFSVCDMIRRCSRPGCSLASDWDEYGALEMPYNSLRSNHLAPRNPRRTYTASTVGGGGWLADRPSDIAMPVDDRQVSPFYLRSTGSLRLTLMRRDGIYNPNIAFNSVAQSATSKISTSCGGVTSMYPASSTAAAFASIVTSLRKHSVAHLIKDTLDCERNPLLLGASDMDSKSRHSPFKTLRSDPTDKHVVSGGRHSNIRNRNPIKLTEPRPFNNDRHSILISGDFKEFVSQIPPEDQGSLFPPITKPPDEAEPMMLVFSHVRPLKESDHIDSDTAAAFLRQLLEGLDFLHRNEVHPTRGYPGICGVASSWSTQVPSLAAFRVTKPDVTCPCVKASENALARKTVQVVHTIELRWKTLERPSSLTSPRAVLAI